jgi:ABC-type uncharacterized transport system permease subunit
MKGYTLICDVENGGEWYYVTIETSHLSPLVFSIVDKRFARYFSTDFIIKKITSCWDNTKTITEINNGLCSYKHKALCL